MSPLGNSLQYVGSHRKHKRVKRNSEATTKDFMNFLFKKKKRFANTLHYDNKRKPYIKETIVISFIADFNVKILSRQRNSEKFKNHF